MAESHHFQFHDFKSGGALHVRVQAGAKKTELAEILDDGTIKIRLTAPAVEGKANHALIEYLSKILKVKSSSIEIVAGLRSRDKLVTVTNISIEQIDQTIHNAVK
jgi:uncharacterized protein (TIGR00251 family)